MPSGSSGASAPHANATTLDARRTAMNQFERIRSQEDSAQAASRSVLLDVLHSVFRLDAMRDLLSAYRRSTAATFARFESLLLPIGLCGAFGMPLYYFIWTELFPQTYENLTLRLAGGLFCLLMAAKPVWPKVLRPYLSLTWHACLLFCIPFFFSFMLLMNGGSPVWLVTWLCGFFMLVVIVNWMNLVLFLFVGIAMAVGAYELTAAQATTYGWVTQQIPVFFFALIAGTLASYRRGMAQQERFAGISAIGRNLARELNGPLRGMTAAAVGLKQYLPVVLQAGANRPDVDVGQAAIPVAHLKALEETPARIQSDLQRISAIIQMLAGNSEEVDWRALTLARLSIDDCIRLALRRYPFSSDTERRLVRWRGGESFVFLGQQEMIVRALMSVLKAALSSVIQFGRGEIEISLTRGEPFNVVTVLLAGVRIPSRLIPQVFDAQSSLESSSGTGPGLYLAKHAVEACGGDLSCRNAEDGETRFEFRLPAAPA